MLTTAAHQMTPSVPLVARLHVDLCRRASAACCCCR
ncbi:MULTISPECIES: putative leader peptide [Streptomyces]|nr:MULTISPECIES: putative leader peptide [unclassified Streptomyces]